MLCGITQLGNQVFADESVAKVTASSNVETTMKTMSLNYRQAMLASEPNIMLARIIKLKELVASVQLVKFEPKRQSILQQGLKEVQLQLDLVQATLINGDITTAKRQLEKVDALKKKYHKKRSPSMWELLFGSD